MRPITRTFARSCHLAVLVACAKEQPREPPRPEPRPVPVPVTPRSLDDDRWVLLERHAATDAEATYLAIELAGDAKAAPRLVPLATRPAIARADWPGHYDTVAAHRADRWAYATADAVVVGVTANVSGGKPSRRIALPVAPTGLFLTGDALYIGAAQSVGWIDLAAATPAYVELAKRADRFKAYDRFVRDGARLVAIDDEVVPMYADWFALDGAGRPTKRLGDWKLPGVINGHYDHAALLATGADEWTLYLAAPYGILDGNGQDLAAIPVRADKLVFAPDLTLQNRDGKTPIVEEHEPRGTKGTATLLAGTKLTPWTGMAVARDAKRVLLAAGSRGLLVLPADFTMASTAEVVDLKGDVRDVVDRGPHLLVLVTQPSPQDSAELVILAGDGKTEVARHRLPATFDRFVD